MLLGGRQVLAVSRVPRRLRGAWVRLDPRRSAATKSVVCRFFRRREPWIEPVTFPAVLRGLSLVVAASVRGQKRPISRLSSLAVAEFGFARRKRFPDV